MKNHQKFVGLVTRATNEQRTGKIYAYTHAGGKLTFATLFFINGALGNCEFLGKSGDLALTELIGSQLTTAVFVAGDGSDYIQDPSIRDVEALLYSIEHLSTDNAQSSFKPTNYQGIATDALKTICGDNAIELVNDLAERYPPDINQHKFIEECVKLASKFVGTNIANDILKPLLALRE